MAENLGKWPSGRGPISKIRPSDGCGRDAVPLAVGRWYDFHEFGLHLGNVDLTLSALRPILSFADRSQPSVAGPHPPRRAGDVFSTAARHHPPESRHLSASPGAASPLNRPAGPVHPRPRYWRPDRRRHRRRRGASPGWRRPRAFH